MTEYGRKLIETIQDSEKWPSFEKPDFLLDLNELADEAREKDTIEGYLAALLIYHQLCEEMIKLLLRDARFFIQVAIFPAEITFQEKHKVMFGPLLDELEATISFEDKNTMIAKCKELNKIRIDFVHGLTKRTTLDDIRSGLANVKELYDNIFDLFDNAHDGFRLSFSNFKKDGEWNSYLTEFQD